VPSCGCGHHLPDRGHAAMALNTSPRAHVATPGATGRRCGQHLPDRGQATAPRAHVATPARHSDLRPHRRRWPSPAGSRPTNRHFAAVPPGRCVVRRWPSPAGSLPDG
jgi:hypothetical protein